jgi:hypothetical protein
VAVVIAEVVVVAKVVVVATDAVERDELLLALDVPAEPSRPPQAARARITTPDEPRRERIILPR